MKNLLSLLLIPLFLLLSAPVYGEAPMVTQAVTVAGLKPPVPKHIIEVQFPKYTQATLSNIHLEYIPVDSETEEKDMLLVKAAVKNLLNRALINASVTVTFYDADGGMIQSADRDIVPKRIDDDTRAGRFYLKIKYNANIAACIIDINWSGKK